ncbi:MAG: M50 family metallopeptidase [Candidatus Hodarchaeales archaeon]|jgi:Zn-dependent protease
MEKKPDWMKDLEKKNFLDRFHLSVQELSEMGIGWMITSFVILYITGTLNEVFTEGTIPNELVIYLFILGISFFGHELAHKFVAIKFGAKAYFKLSREALFLTLISVMIGFPLLATGAVFWWGEAASSQGIRGRVSAAGPLANFIFAGLFLILQGLGMLVFFDFNQIELGLLLVFIGSTGVWLNAFLGVFNLLPIGVLDGAKVLAWDPKIWISLIGSLIVIGFSGIISFLPF